MTRSGKTYSIGLTGGAFPYRKSVRPRSTDSYARNPEARSGKEKQGRQSSRDTRIGSDTGHAAVKGTLARRSSRTTPQSREIYEVPDFDSERHSLVWATGMRQDVHSTTSRRGAWLQFLRNLPVLSWFSICP